MPKFTPHANQSRFNQGPILPQFVHDYMAHGAQKGDRNDTLFKVAAQYLHAGIAEADIAPQLIARAVADGLSLCEAQKAITSAFNSQKKEPLGGHNIASGNSNFPKRKFVPGPSSTRPFSMPLPPPIPDGFKRYLENNFKAGEGVSVSETIIENGNRRPGKGDLATREEWLAKIAIKPLEKYYAGGEGIFVRINPTSGSKIVDVTDFRHGLFEADKDSAGKLIPKEEQYAALINSHLPCRAILDSGDRSIHAVVHLGAGLNRAEYDRRYALCFEALEGHWIDDNNKDITRYSRVPGVPRRLYDENGNFVGNGRQELLALNVGEASFEEWEAKWCVDPLEQEISNYYFLRTVPDFGRHYPPQLIEGLLYQGEKLTLIGPSKSFKTWTLMDIFLCVSNGIPFLDRFPTHQVNTAFLDFESLEASIRHRFEAIAKAHGLDPVRAFDFVKAASFKGRLSNGFANFCDPKVQRVLVKILIDAGIGLYGVDPTYHVYHGADENSNSAMADLFASFDLICRESRSAFASTHHFAKGNAFQKDPLDRGAGAGAISGRAPGAVMIFTPHKEPHCFTVDLIVRDFPVIDSFVVRRRHPLMVIDTSLDPKDLLTPPTAVAPKVRDAQKEGRLNSIMTAVRMVEPNGVTAARLRAATGIAESTMRTYLPQLVSKGMIYRSPLDDKYHLSPSQAAAWGNAPL